MHVLIHGLNYAPEPIGIGKYTGELAAQLVRRKTRVSVVTAPPYYPAWRVSDGYRPFLYRRENRDSVDVVRCPIWVPRQVSGLKRILHLATFGISSAPMVMWRALRRPDIVFVVEPSMFCLASALAAARFTGAKAWLHVQDFEVDAAFELGILRRRWMQQIVLKVEAFLMRRFDRVSSISPRMTERLAQKGVAADRVRLFPNWVDCNEMRPLENSADHRAEFGIPPDKCVALYAGNIGDKQGLEIIFQAARALASEDDVYFVICGRGAAYDRLHAMSEGLPNVRWLPVQPSDKFNALMNIADVHLLPQRGDAADLVMPSKLTGMLATGRPVVACAKQGTQIADVVDGCGVVVPPEDVEAFVTAIRTLTADQELRGELGRNARDYALKNLAIGPIIDRFLDDLEGCLMSEEKLATLQPDESLPAPAATRATSQLR